VTADRDERRATSNEAALRFLLRAKGVANLPDHAALRRLAADQPAAFQAAIQAFAGVIAPPDMLAALLLEADLRPDDRVLAGKTTPAWLDALAQVVDAPDALPGTPRAIDEAERASVVVAPPAARAVYPDGSPGATADPMPALPTRPGVVPNTVRKAAPKAGTLA
jgi:hypothetical protein